MAHLWRGVLTEYRDRLPVGPGTPVVTLGEGGTPLTRARTLSDITSCDVWIKFEGANPTGSFKDRGMTMAITKAVEEGSRAVICASTGNTSASAARLPSPSRIRTCWRTVSMETSCSAKTCAIWASTPGRSSTSRLTW